MNSADIHTWALEGAVRASTVPPGADISAIVLEECAMIMRVGSSFGHNVSRTEASLLLTSEFASFVESAVSTAMSSFAELNSGYLPNISEKIGIATNILELIGNTAFSYFEGKSDSIPAEQVTEDKVYTVSEAADILSLSEYTVRQKIREGEIKAVKGKSDREGYRIYHEDLMSYLRKNGKNRNKSWLSIASAFPIGGVLASMLPIVAGAACIAPMSSLPFTGAVKQSKNKSKVDKKEDV